MTAVAITLPSPKACTTPKCGVTVVTVASWRGRPVHVEPRPHPDGTVHLHGSSGRTVAQTLGADAAKAFRQARLPLWRRHQCEESAR